MICSKGMEKILVLKTKRLLYDFIIIKEWINNEEFIKTDKIIVLGARLQAVMVNFLFRGSHKKLYYITKLNGQYRYRKHVKWIVFDEHFNNALPKNDCNILYIPHI